MTVSVPVFTKKKKLSVLREFSAGRHVVVVWVWSPLERNLEVDPLKQIAVLTFWNWMPAGWGKP